MRSTSHPFAAMLRRAGPDAGLSPSGRLATHLALLSSVVLAAGCGSLPKTGPSVSDIDSESQSTRTFRFVDLSAETMAILRQRPVDGFASSFGVGSPDAASDPSSDVIVGVGDTLTIHLWETGANPLFSSGTGGGSATASSSAAGRAMTLPEQVVGADGKVFVPFAGLILAAGRTLSQIRDSIEQALHGKTQTPQVLVTLGRSESNSVLVLGDATAGKRYPLGPRPTRVLDVLADLGGSRAPIYETRVRLTRGSVTAELPLTVLMSDPAQNVELRAGDQLTVTRKSETYTVFGATGRNAQVPFEETRVNLVEAIARAGGLLDQRADPAGVYLLRYEPASLAGTLPAQNAEPPEANANVGGEGGPVPVIYHLDLMQAGNYFLGQDFAMRDHDVLYVASAATNQLQKFLTLVGLVSQPVIQGVIVEQTTHN